MAENDKTSENLPNSAVEYINLVIKKMRYRRKARDEVREDLLDHFEVYLKDCATNEEKEQKAQQLISGFGDPKILAVLMRRAKKRCRPLWQKILVRSFASALLIFAYLLICASWLRMGTPTIRINYAQLMTDQQKQGRDESLNAKIEMDKAALLLSKSDDSLAVYNMPHLWPGDMNDAQKQLISKTLQANAETLNTLNKSLEKPYYWEDYNRFGSIAIEANSIIYLNPDLIQSDIKLLAQYRQVARLMATRIEFGAYSGDIDGAVNDIISLHRFASHLEGQGLLIEQLVAMAIEGLAHSRTTNILARVDIPAAQLKHLQDELTVTFAKREFPIDINDEKAFWYALIQQCFTDDGRGNGKMLKAGMHRFVRDWKNAVWSFLTFSYPDRRQALAQVEKIFAEGQQNYQTTPWQKKGKTFTKPTDSAYGLSIFSLLTLANDRTSAVVWRAKTQREATLTILAALRFQKEKGKFPDNLDELVKAGYLTKLPVDPFSPGSLTYKKTADGFLLYSWGENLKDDDGQIARDEKGKLKMFADTGDWVFWPVVKN
ncbi:MAG: hypothetical protein WBL85_08290 [Sedimentisphaerales bacterium]